MRTPSANVAVVSPNGGVHAVRPGAGATACGTDYRRKRRRAQNGRSGWVRVPAGFEVLEAQRHPAICQRCQECLRDDMGPGAGGPSDR